MSVVSLRLLYLGAFLLSGVLLSGVAWWIHQSVNQREAPAFALVNLIAAIWCLAAGLKLIVSSIQLKAVFLQLALGCFVSLPAAWVWFVTEYTSSHDTWMHRIRYGLAAVTGVLLVGILTNPVHWEYLSYARASFPFPHLILTEAVGYWIGYAYTVTVISLSCLYLIRLSLNSATHHKAQIFLLFLGLIGVASAHLVSQFGLTPGITIDVTPVGMGFYGMCVTAAMYRYHFLDITPVARERVVEDLDDPVIVLDSRGQITDYNAATTGLFRNGDSDPSIIGEHPTDVFAVDLLAALTEGGESNTLPFATPTSEPPGHADTPTEPTSTTGTQPSTEMSRKRGEITRRVNGTERTYDVHVSSLRDEQQIVGYAIILRDITTLKQKQQELERQNERLDNFASVVSHDLRNPLNTANGYLDIARETGDAAAFDKIDRAHTRMETIIDDVLSLAREGQTVGETEPVRIDAIAGEAWENVETHDATLTIETEMRVEADPNRLLNLFENIFRNAIEHVGLDVSVTVGALETAAGFYIADDGPGIAEGNRETVFEHGFTTAENGTGFGLNIVQEIVAAHGWTVRVTEAATGGARFEVTVTDSAC